METQSLTVEPSSGPSFSRLSIFAFLWASQALIHQEFYSGWLDQNDPRGWAVTIFAVATLLKPSSLICFSGMLISSIVYNVAKWPFVVNHILMESLLNLTMLSAIAATLVRNGFAGSTTTAYRDEIYRRFAPVVFTILVIMYWFAFLAKLNHDFINPDVSCVVAMYGDLIWRFPFLPDTPTFHMLVIYATLVVEFFIPLLLSFRRTRPIAIFIGLPFHLVLGLVGHRTFSGLAWAVYGMICMDGLVVLVTNLAVRWRRHVSGFRSRLLLGAARTAALATFAGLIAAAMLGEFESRLGPVKVYQLPWLIWIAWSGAVFGAYSVAMMFSRQRGQAPEATLREPRPVLLWLAVPVIVLLGASQYLGLKSETCFTMYSNLRTEGAWNNHFFMPALRLTDWQDDLIEIVSTDHPELANYIEHQELMTYFEFRRFVSGNSDDLQVTYRRKGQLEEFVRADGLTHSTDTIDTHPALLGRVIYFRPVPVDDCMPCRH